MHDGDLIPIGELARRTGLTVRTPRLYADSGLVAPAARSDAGYRFYDAAAAARAARCCRPPPVADRRPRR